MRAADVDSGEPVALRVSTGGRHLQVETPFNEAAYPWTTAGLTLIALVMVMASWHTSAWLARRRQRWLPAELSRTRR